MSYNHATTNLAKSFNKMSQDKLSKEEISSLVLSSRYKTNYIKTQAHFSETVKVVQNLLRKAYGKTLNY